MPTAAAIREKPARLSQAKLAPTSTSIALRRAFEEYLTYHRRRGSAERYIDFLDYFLGDRQKEAGSKFRPLLRWCADRKIATVDELTRDSLNAWLDELLQVSTEGQHAKAASCLKRFLNFLVNESLITKLPMKVILPKTRQAEIEVFTMEEVEALAAVVKRENPRDWAIFLMLLDTGIRASELCAVRIQDIHWGRGDLVIHKGKGNKQRTVHLDTSLTALQQYRTMRGDDTSQTDAFFLAFYPGNSPVFAGGNGRAKRRTIDKFSFASTPLSRIGLFQLVKKWGKLAGITDARCSPHTFRHFFAVQYLREGGDILSLKDILGHSKIDTTMVYAKLAHADVKRFHKSFSPAKHFVSARYRKLDKA